MDIISKAVNVIEPKCVCFVLGSTDFRPTTWEI